MLFCVKHVTLPIFQLELMIKWSSTVQMNRSLHVGLKITLLNAVLSYGAIEF